MDGYELVNVRPRANTSMGDMLPFDQRQLEKAHDIMTTNGFINVNEVAIRAWMQNRTSRGITIRQEISTSGIIFKKTAKASITVMTID